MDWEANTASQCGRAKAPKARSERLSKVVNHIPQSDAQRLGYLQQRINGDGPVRAFDLTDINRMQIGLFRQSFLTQSCLLPVQTDVFADQLAVFRNGGHGPLQHRKRGREAISYQLKFILANGKGTISVA